MKLMRGIGTAIFTIALLSSCMTTGKNFPSDTDWIVKDSSTEDDVELLLGAPTAVGSSGGVRTWTYGYYTYSLWSNASYKELKIYWNPNHTVQHFTFTSSFPQDIATKAKKPTKNALPNKVNK
jgi:outer membrane protein assembly factor BamE (lipoprotein component of BamABCDE complex)